LAKAILIDSAAREVREVEVSGGLGEIQEAVGGYIEAAFYHPKGDVLFIDEEGLLKAQAHFFRYAPRADPQPLGGNGIIIGAEKYDANGEFAGNDDVSVSVDEVRGLVQFLSREQADAWAKGNASEPFASFTFIEKGILHTEVTGRFGELFANMPKPDSDKSE